MTLKEFEAKLAQDKNLASKFEELKTEGLKSAENDRDAFNVVKAVSKELGYEVDDTDAVLEAIISKELDEGELEAVSGGSGWDKKTEVSQCLVHYHCYGALIHPSKQDKNTACWSDFLCKVVLNPC